MGSKSLNIFKLAYSLSKAKQCEEFCLYRFMMKSHTKEERKNSQTYQKQKKGVDLT